MAELSFPDPQDPLEGRRFILELDRRLEHWDRAILVADWDLFTGKNSAGSERLQLERSRFLSDDKLLGWIRKASQRRWPPLIRRRLQLLDRIVVDAQVEQSVAIVKARSKLQRRIVAFRPRWNGKRVERFVLHRVLREDPDAQNRKRAYYGLESLYRPLEEPLRQLIRLRNERARDLGYANFAALRLSFEGFAPDKIEELARAGLPLARTRIALLRARPVAGLEGGGWHPWDLDLARFGSTRLPEASFPQRSMLATILRAVKKWGFPVERMRFRAVFHDLPSGGLTLAPDPPNDVRILVHRRGGWNAYDVMFHEVGHAVHSASIRAPRHLLRWHENIPGFGGLHEGIAGLFEEIARDEAWLSTQPRIDPSAARSFAQSWRDWDAQSIAYLASWILVELDLYRNPERDPTSAAHRLARRVFGYDEFSPLSFADSFYIDSPVYAANYLLATYFHYQLARDLRERFGEPLWPNPRVGPYLMREWFAPGSIYDWVPRVRKLTGRPFGAKDFLASFEKGPD